MYLTAHSITLLSRIHHDWFIHLPIDGHLDCFQFCTVTNKTAANIYVQVFVWTCFHFCWVNTQQWNSSMVWQMYVECLRNCQAFYEMFIPCYISTSRVRVLTHSCQCPVNHFNFSYSNRQWDSIVVLTCISLMTNDVEHIFICLFAICISSLVSVGSNLLPTFKIVLLFLIVEVA